jgi:hypothetical protein
VNLMGTQWQITELGSRAESPGVARWWASHRSGSGLFGSLFYLFSLVSLLWLGLAGWLARERLQMVVRFRLLGDG